LKPTDVKPTYVGESNPTVVLGFGDRTATYKAQPVSLEAGEWHRLGFNYDGAGRVTIYLNGQEIGRGTDAGAG